MYNIWCETTLVLDGMQSMQGTRHRRPPCHVSPLPRRLSEEEGEEMEEDPDEPSLEEQLATVKDDLNLGQRERPRGHRAQLWFTCNGV